MKKQNKVLGMKLTYLTMLLLIVCYSCSKDCPDEVKTTKKTYSISEVVKKTFPYNFKDTQIWINVNTNDTLHYILKDTLSTYDTTNSTPLEGCKENNYVYTENLTYNLICTENSLFNYNHIYKSYLGLGFDEKVKFMNVVYTEFIGDLIDIDNYGIIFKRIYVSKFFAKNDSLGILRITANNEKLFRIK